MTHARIAVIGGTGQVARALAAREAAASGGGGAIIARGRPDVDITDHHSLASFLYAVQPAVVVNAAAYTAVDRAESEPEAAFRTNAEGPARLAVMCAAARAPLIHVSTDYVFDGTKAVPYAEDDALCPISVYGASKAAGEDAVRAGTPHHVILRTSWVYDAEGRNFLRTMLRLGAERDEVRVVGDQHGAPTSADDLAGAILSIAARLAGRETDGLWGTYHLTAGGETTWHGFAARIFERAAAAGIKTPRLEAIPTDAYPTAARRPANSRLDTSKIAGAFGISLPPWQAGVDRTVARIVDASAAEGRVLWPRGDLT